MSTKLAIVTQRLEGILANLHGSPTTSVSISVADQVNRLIAMVAEELPAAVPHLPTPISTKSHFEDMGIVALNFGNLQILIQDVLGTIEACRPK